MFLFVFFAMFFQSSNQQNYKVPLDTYFGQYTHLVVYTRSTSYEQTTPVGEIRRVEGEERKGQSDETYLIVILASSLFIFWVGHGFKVCEKS